MFKLVQTQTSSATSNLTGIYCQTFVTDFLPIREDQIAAVNPKTICKVGQAGCQFLALPMSWCVLTLLLIIDPQNCLLKLSG